MPRHSLIEFITLLAQADPGRYPRYLIPQRCYWFAHLVARWTVVVTEPARWNPAIAPGPRRMNPPMPIANYLPAPRNSGAKARQAGIYYSPLPDPGSPDDCLDWALDCTGDT